MDSLNFWRLCEEMTVDQAAHLLIGMVPGEVEALASIGGYMEREDRAKYEINLGAAKVAISNAFKRGAIAGHLVPLYQHDINGNRCGEVDQSIDLDASLLEVESLRQWLKSRGFTSGFFFSADAEKTPDYLDPRNPRYAPKLAAAIHAWLAVTDPGKTSPKKALDKWLRENAAQFGLTDDEGLPINQAVEDCSKVANWNQTGGAPKTPAG